VCEQWIAAQRKRCTDQAWALIMSPDYSEPVYIWFRIGSLVAATHKPAPDYQLVDPRRVPTDRERHQVGMWIRDITQRAPLLPSDEVMAADIVRQETVAAA
jgi:hypothetical protein